MSAVLYDVNIWLALAFDQHPHHALAKSEFAMANNLRPAVFCRTTQQAFLRLVTSPAIQKVYGIKGITNNEAWDVWQQLDRLPQVTWLEEPLDLQALWEGYACRQTSSPKVWMDAYLAAFAKGHHIGLITLDGDFLNFDGLLLKHLVA